jgi:hypothetical protein
MMLRVFTFLVLAVQAQAAVSLVSSCPRSLQAFHRLHAA